MKPSIILTRPEKDNIKFSSKISEVNKGSNIINLPLIEIEILGREINFPENSNLIITSANGVEALSKNTKIRNFNIITAGDNSAEIASKLGFQRVFSAYKKKSKISGEIAIANFIKENFSKGEKFIHISADVTKGNLEKLIVAENFFYKREIFYKSKQNKLSKEKIKEIQALQECLVVFFSERTAKIFIDNFIDLSKFSAVTLSKQIADSIANYNFANIIYPEFPTENSLIEIINKL
ncbi:MAG: uroporphyrinogen-III synthase [Rickettsiales bacterium]|nr:uroporphyrinogen-III synthase [Rickettsiales bacterium]